MRTIQSRAHVFRPAALAHYRSARLADGVADDVGVVPVPVAALLMFGVSTALLLALLLWPVYGVGRGDDAAANPLNLVVGRHEARS
jgi:hypothetical protein